MRYILLVASTLFINQGALAVTENQAIEFQETVNGIRETKPHQGIRLADYSQKSDIYMNRIEIPKPRTHIEEKPTYFSSMDKAQNEEYFDIINNRND